MACIRAAKHRGFSAMVSPPAAASAEIAYSRLVFAGFTTVQRILSQNVNQAAYRTNRIVSCLVGSSWLLVTARTEMPPCRLVALLLFVLERARAPQVLDGVEDNFPAFALMMTSSGVADLLYGELYRE